MRTEVLTVVAMLAFGALPAFAQTGLTGYVREQTTGAPVRGAELIIEALKRSAKTDDSGRYVLRDLPAGIRMVTIRSIGYDATGFMVQLAAGEMKNRDFTLDRTAQQLDTAKTVAEGGIYGRRLTAFDEHRNRGFGVFIDSTELKNRAVAKVSDLLMAMSGIKLVMPPQCRPVGSRRENCGHSTLTRVAMNRSGCALQVVLDGTIVARGGPVANGDPAAPGERLHDWPSQFDLTTMNASSLVAVEVYRTPGEVPIEMSGFGQECGAMYMWTKR